MRTIDNDHSYWKTFRDNLLTHSSAHYLHAIAQLLDQKGYARVTDVARQLEITKAAASQGISILKARGLVLEDEARMLSLSGEGRGLIVSIENNYNLLASLFEQVLNVSQDVARTDACKMEHLLSPETAECLAQFLEALLDSPELCRQLRDCVSSRPMRPRS